MKKMIRYGGSVRTRTVPRGSPIGYPKGGTPPLPPVDYFLFNGVDQYVDIPPWLPTTAEYRISCYIRYVATVAGAVNSVVGQDANTTAIYLNTSLGIWYSRSLTVPGNAFIASGVDATTDTTVFAELIVDVDAPGQSFQVTGGSVVTNPAIPILPTSGVTRIGGRTGAFFNGFVYGVALTDDADPSNSRWYPMNEGDGADIQCYEGDQTTPDPTNDGTIVNYTDNWQPLGAQPYSIPPPVGETPTP